MPRQTARSTRRSATLARFTLALTLLIPVGCAEQTEDRQAAASAIRADSGAVVLNLGNLRTGKPPSRAESQLASFLFGVEPDAPLSLLKPMDLAAEGDGLLISEGAFQSVLRWSSGTGELVGVSLSGVDAAPGALALAEGGDLLLAGGDGVARRISATGAVHATYRLPPEPRNARIGGLVLVGKEVWITNATAHRIEIFDAQSGAHLRSLGSRGRGRGEFGFPLGIAYSAEAVYVVDMLNDRVQVLDADGEWLRDLGGPGDRVGRFGRPRAVAVGPDGVVFVVDAASQRVHAFDERGRSLLAFGGASDGADALVLPAGITICTNIAPRAGRQAPSDFKADYYVLVSEQLVRPGVRVFAWHSAPRNIEPAPRASSFRLVASVSSPHRAADQCTVCHAEADGSPAGIAPTRVDAICLSCHDGKHAIAEAHPIGRPGITARAKTPSDWPLVNGRLGCLTCHDYRGHYAPPAAIAARLRENPAQVRGFDAQDPMQSCRQCHVAENWRINPHRGTFPGMTSPTASCGFCHVSAPRGEVVAQAGKFDAALKESTTNLCLNCHTPHADPAPRGHLNVHVQGDYLANLTAHDANSVQLPLDNGAISCATCHNPHPADAEYKEHFASPAAQLRSTAAADAGKSLRMENMDLCRHCHPK